MKRIVACHSGLTGIFPCFQKDSRRASLAGMTAFKVFTCRGNNNLKEQETALNIISQHQSEKVPFGSPFMSNAGLDSYSFQF